jgi:hypothetical protein
VWGGGADRWDRVLFRICLRTAQGAIDLYTKRYTDILINQYTWVYSRSLTSSVAQTTDRFGTSISMNGFALVTGTPDRFSSTQSDIVRACSCACARVCVRVCACMRAWACACPLSGPLFSCLFAVFVCALSTLWPRSGRSCGVLLPQDGNVPLNVVRRPGACPRRRLGARQFWTDRGFVWRLYRRRRVHAERSQGTGLVWLHVLLPLRASAPWHAFVLLSWLQG